MRTGPPRKSAADERTRRRGAHTDREILSGRPGGENLRPACFERPPPLLSPSCPLGVAERSCHLTTPPSPLCSRLQKRERRLFSRVFLPPRALTAPLPNDEFCPPTRRLRGYVSPVACAVLSASPLTAYPLARPPARLPARPLRESERRGAEYPPEMQPGDREHRQSSLPRSLQRHLRSGPQSPRTTEPLASTVASSAGTSAPRDETDTDDKDDDPFYDDDDGRWRATRMRAYAREREHGPRTRDLAPPLEEHALAGTAMFSPYPARPLMTSAPFAHALGGLPSLPPLHHSHSHSPTGHPQAHHPPQGPRAFSHSLPPYDGGLWAGRFMDTDSTSYTYPPPQRLTPVPSRVPQRTIGNGEAGSSTRTPRPPTARVLASPAAPPPLDPWRRPQGHGLEEPHAPTHAPFWYAPAPRQGYTEGEVQSARERDERGRRTDEPRRAAADLDRQAAAYNREGASILLSFRAPFRTLTAGLTFAVCPRLLLDVAHGRSAHSFSSAGTRPFYDARFGRVYDYYEPLPAATTFDPRTHGSLPPLAAFGGAARTSREYAFLPPPMLVPVPVPVPMPAPAPEQRGAPWERERELMLRPLRLGFGDDDDDDRERTRGDAAGEAGGSGGRAPVAGPSRAGAPGWLHEPQPSRPIPLRLRRTTSPEGMPRAEEEESKTGERRRGARTAPSPLVGRKRKRKRESNADDSDSEGRARAAPKKTAMALSEDVGRGDGGGVGRKLKCSGDRPECENCKNRGLPCVYEPVQRRRGPGKKTLAAQGQQPNRGTRGGPAPAAGATAPAQSHAFVRPSDLAAPSAPHTRHGRRSGRGRGRGGRGRGAGGEEGGSRETGSREGHGGGKRDEEGREG
ncbi:hypothetical protein HETIRDRAFT_451441 [Heterobasidion irregulare TC 32-1]|uniref:Zn(2)-C6 fungal-type domain-containing protein n=1 Tax=Heterobasidion irregulare (strain TC 32-1) TaxID=747525 RepID=W4K8P7_HETIT|nr:uncharacterized protein HETIRDRAFT_451441 [Heterobasidion irregulare TC 32-1]ETW81720.1 hypothetical protein HETIRDRAFT_451441 [Heterobasidion irregulare TC 32-1]